MRKIESLIISAVKARHNLRNRERDEVIYDADENKLIVKLWNHTIAKVCYDSCTVTLSDCGYSTPTTMSRLNAATAAIGLPVTFLIKDGCTVVYKCGKLTEEKEFTCNGWTVKISDYEA